MVIEFGKAGKSRTWIATELGVHKDTLYEWQKQHPAFSDALARAKQWEQRWWEDKGQSGMEQMGFNASVWNRSMAARFPDDWREQTENKTTLDATDNFASLLTKLGSQSVFPGDERKD